MFTAVFKAAILAEYDAAERGQRGRSAPGGVVLLAPDRVRRRGADRQVRRNHDVAGVASWSGVSRPLASHHIDPVPEPVGSDLHGWALPPSGNTRAVNAVTPTVTPEVTRIMELVPIRRAT